MDKNLMTVQATNQDALILSRLNVFARSFTREAARGVCSGGGITRRQLDGCIDRSLECGLLQHAGDDGGGRLRFVERVSVRMARGGDPADHLKGIHARHYRWYLALLQGAAPHMHGKSQGRWLRHLKRDRANIDAALRWSLRPEARRDEALSLAVACFWFWFKLGLYSDGIGWTRTAMARGTPCNSVLLMKAHNVLGMLLNASGDIQEANEVLLGALDLAKTMADPQAEAAIRNNLASSYRTVGNLTAAGDMLDRSVVIYRQLDQRHKLAQTLNNLGSLHVEAYELATGRKLLAEAQTLAAELEDVWLAANIDLNLGEAEFRLDRFDQAEMLLCRAVSSFHAQGDYRGVACGLRCLAGLACNSRAYRRCVGLLVLADRARDLSGVELPASEVEETAKWADEAREQLGEDAYEASWAEATAGELDPAIRFAIGHLD